MFTGQIYIQETANSDVAFINSYLKDVLGVTKLYIYIPLIGNSVSDYALIADLLASGRIPKSAYDQALVNMPISASGEFETTEAVNLPSASDVYDEIIKIPQLAGLVSPTDTLDQLVTAIDASGYLVTFNNIDMFINNSIVGASVTVRTITSDDTLVVSDDIIEIDASSNNVELTLLATNTKVIGVKRIDKTNNIASIIVDGGGTIDGQDELTIVNIIENEPDLYIQLYYSATDTEYKIIA